jgi:hypothetical protein
MRGVQVDHRQRRQDEWVDARKLALIARADVGLLAQVEHRSAEQQTTDPNKPAPGPVPSIARITWASLESLLSQVPKRASRKRAIAKEEMDTTWKPSVRSLYAMIRW